MPITFKSRPVTAQVLQAAIDKVTTQVVPAGFGSATGDHQIFCPVFKDTTGKPDRCVVVVVLSTNTVSVTDYTRLNNAWIYDAAVTGRDQSVTLNFTVAVQGTITAFAIDDPAGTGDLIVFIAGSDGSASPDTFEMDSIVMAVGAGAKTATAVVIAGANAPPDANNVGVCSIPLSTVKVMTINQDDAYFADITESGGTYTFTYTDSVVTAIDTSIAADTTAAPRYSGMLIGSQVCLYQSAGQPGISDMWELTPAAVLTPSASIKDSPVS